MAFQDQIEDEAFKLFPEYNRIEQVKKYINENIKSDLRAAIISQKFELSISSLQHLFRKYQLQSCHQYIQDVRLNRAFELITKEGKRISEAMYAVGYENRSTFNTAFKKKFKHRPGRFRK
jgi:two-component system, response regulator YesN